MIELVVKTENPPDIGLKWHKLQNHSFAIVDKKVENINVKHFYRLRLTESGGGKKNSGKASIITSISGEKLVPCVKYSKKAKKCGTHALFVGREFIKITASHLRKKFTVKLEHHYIDDEECIYKILDIWCYNDIKINQPTNIYNVLPISLLRYAEPIVYCIEKALCFHCTCLHYVKGE